MEGIEPTTPRLQITCSGQLSYIGIVFPPLEKYLSRFGIAKIGINFLSPKLFNLFSIFFQIHRQKGHIVFRQTNRNLRAVLPVWPDL